MSTVGPIVIALLLSVAYFIQLYYTKSKPESTSDDITTVKSFYLYLILFGSFLILPGTCTFIFRTFACHDVDPYGQTPGEHIYLRADYTLSCTTERYYNARALAIVMIFVYPLGIPLFYLYLLWGNRHLLRERQNRELTPAEHRLIQPAEFLYQAYEPRCWYW